MTDRLPWSEWFGVGVPALDEDHRRMVAAINGFCAAAAAGATPAQLGTRLDALVRLSREHFRREEEVVRRTESLSRAAGAAHEREHGIRLAQLQDIRRALPAELTPEQVEEFGNALIDWFIQQAVGFDAQIRAYYVDR